MSSQDWKYFFDYNKDTGVLTWIVDTGNVKKGTVAGSLDSKGHLRVSFKNKKYAVHRIAYEIVYGAIPYGMEIDHINRIKTDNRIYNLRLATHTQNACNAKKRKDNCSGYVGVFWVESRLRWVATIRVNGTKKYLGSFKTKEEAYAVRLKAELTHHGDFAHSIERVA
jgi:hypothetical protein